jgi:hypothetical protein
MSASTLHPRGPALLAGVIVALAAYLAGWLGWIPVVVYQPTSGAFTFSPDPDLIAMSYYGLLLLGAAGYALGYSAGRLLTAGRSPSPGTSRVLVRVAAAVALLALVAVAVAELGLGSATDAERPAAPRSDYVAPTSLPAAG